jgi:hypothetical protein
MSVIAGHLIFGGDRLSLTKAARASIFQNDVSGNRINMRFSLGFCASRQTGFLWIIIDVWLTILLSYWAAAWKEVDYDKYK